MVRGVDEIPTDFKEEYMRYYCCQIRKSELLKKFNISSWTFRVWVEKSKLPVYSQYSHGGELFLKGIPENFEEEYMKYYNSNGKILRAEVCAKFQIDPSTMRSWRKRLNLPAITTFKAKGIPENFEEEYMKYYRGEQTRKDLCEKFSISGDTSQRWRDKLKLPSVHRHKHPHCETLRSYIPVNFEEEYMKYYNGIIQKDNLLKNFDISQDIFEKWRKILKLPALRSKVPFNFEELYIKFYKGVLSKEQFLKDCEASEVTVCRWRNKLNLPKKKNATPYSLEGAQKDFITFSIFGHKLTIRNPFKVEKIEPPISVNLSDEFPDEVEY